MQVLPLVGLAILRAYLTVAFALLGVQPDNQGVVWAAIGIGLLLIGVCLLVACGLVALTFVRRRWAYALLLILELVALAFFGLNSLLAAEAGATPDIEDSTLIVLRAVVLALPLLPVVTLFFLLMPRGSHRYFRL